MPNQSHDTVMSKITQIVADVTGNDIDDVKLDTLLDEELLVEEHDFLRIISEINTAFNIALNGRALMLREKKVETVGDLVDEVSEETEWG